MINGEDDSEDGDQSMHSGLLPCGSLRDCNDASTFKQASKLVRVVQLVATVEGDVNG